MLKLGRYPPQKIQSSHLKYKEHVQDVYNNGDREGFLIGRQYVLVYQSSDVDQKFPLNVSNVLSWSSFAVADQYQNPQQNVFHY